MTQDYIALTDAEVRQRETLKKHALIACEALAEAIKALGEIPSGHLYANMMGLMTLDTYQQIISILVGAKLVKLDNHLLTWIGPATWKPSL